MTSYGRKNSVASSFDLGMTRNASTLANKSVKFPSTLAKDFLRTSFNDFMPR